MARKPGVSGPSNQADARLRSIEESKRFCAIAAAREGGRLGGLARAAKLLPKRRREIAAMGAAARAAKRGR